MDLIEPSVMEEEEGGEWCGEKKALLVLLQMEGEQRGGLQGAGLLGVRVLGDVEDEEEGWALTVVFPLTFQSCNLISWVGWYSGSLRGYR